MTSLKLGFDPPDASFLATWAARRCCADRPLNHNFHAQNHDLLAEDRSNLRVIQLTQKLGKGWGCYHQARARLLAWDMHHGSKQRGIWTNGRGAVVTFAPVLRGVYVINPCRSLSLSDHNGRCTTAVGYATVVGHLIAGVEKMEVSISRADGTVSFKVCSWARGYGVLGRAIFPFLGSMQRRFFHDQVRGMAMPIGVVDAA